MPKLPHNFYLSPNFSSFFFSLSDKPLFVEDLPNDTNIRNRYLTEINCWSLCFFSFNHYRLTFKEPLLRFSSMEHKHTLKIIKVCINNEVYNQTFKQGQVYNII